MGFHWESSESKQSLHLHTAPFWADLSLSLFLFFSLSLDYNHNLFSRYKSLRGPRNNPSKGKLLQCLQMGTCRTWIWLTLYKTNLHLLGLWYFFHFERDGEMDWIIENLFLRGDSLAQIRIAMLQNVFSIQTAAPSASCPPIPCSWVAQSQIIGNWKGICQNWCCFQIKDRYRDWRKEFNHF